MRKLMLILALAAVLAPSLSLAEPLARPEPVPETSALSIEELLLGGSCATEEASLFSLPGCPRPCQVDQNCRHYPEEVCVNGCCAF